MTDSECQHCPSVGVWQTESRSCLDHLAVAARADRHVGPAAAPAANIRAAARISAIDVRATANPRPWLGLEPSPRPRIGPAAAFRAVTSAGRALRRS